MSQTTSFLQITELKMERFLVLETLFIFIKRNMYSIILSQIIDTFQYLLCLVTPNRNLLRSPQFFLRYLTFIFMDRYFFLNTTLFENVLFQKTQRKWSDIVQHFAPHFLSMEKKMQSK